MIFEGGRKCRHAPPAAAARPALRVPVATGVSASQLPAPAACGFGPGCWTAVAHRRGLVWRRSAKRPLQRALIGESPGNAVRLRPGRIAELQGTISVARCRFLRVRVAVGGGGGGGV